MGAARRLRTPPSAGLFIAAGPGQPAGGGGWRKEGVTRYFGCVDIPPSLALRGCVIYFEIILLALPGSDSSAANPRVSLCSSARAHLWFKFEALPRDLRALFPFSIL